MGPGVKKIKVQTHLEEPNREAEERYLGKHICKILSDRKLGLCRSIGYCWTIGEAKAAAALGEEFMGGIMGTGKSLPLHLVLFHNKHWKTG